MIAHFATAGASGAALVAALVSVPAIASEMDISGSIATETRLFLKSGRYAGQLTAFQPSLAFEPELSWREGNWDVFLAPFARLDGKDGNRTHVDFNEAYLRWQGDRATIRLGLIKMFWGVAESRHLVDVVNQHDALEDLDGEDKLGQPAAELTFSADWGEITALIMPFFRKRHYPGSDGRLRLPADIDGDTISFSGNDRFKGPDLALRYSHYLGNWDVGVSVFHGLSREPRLLPTKDQNILRQHYDEISQLGFDLQYTRGAWLWKFEGLLRKTPYETFSASVFGLEYTSYGIGGAAADLGWLVEYQYDGRAQNPYYAPPVLENDDLFVGMRLALNDVADTSLVVGTAFDLEDGSNYGVLEASRRLGDVWTINLEGRFIFEAAQGNLLHTLKNDSHLIARLSYHF